MSSDLFTQIYQGLVAGVGYTWVAWLLLIFCIYVAIIVLIEVDLLTATAVISFPIFLLTIYQMVTLGAWGLAALVIVVGFVFGVSIYRLFVN